MAADAAALEMPAGDDAAVTILAPAPAASAKVALQTVFSRLKTHSAALTAPCACFRRRLLQRCHPTCTWGEQFREPAHAVHS